MSTGKEKDFQKFLDHFPCEKEAYESAGGVPKNRSVVIERELQDWMFAALGKGNAQKGVLVLLDIAMRLVHARTKHAWPSEAYGRYQALGVIHEEFKELEHAVEKESVCRQKDEALDVICTALRFYLGEHEVEDEKETIDG